MKTKLTLRVEKKLIKKAKKYAKSQKTSVSQLVADYLSALDQEREAEEQQNLPPLTSSLVGILEGGEATEKDYRNHLEAKHLE